jgi:ABC-type spermidine/putrescine transport system permease subunit II
LISIARNERAVLEFYALRAAGGADVALMYGRMREGASPVLNAVSLLLMVASAMIALALMRRR